MFFLNWCFVCRAAYTKISAHSCLSICMSFADCMPPAITTQARMTVYFHDSTKVDLPCIAQGKQTLV